MQFVICPAGDNCLAMKLVMNIDYKTNEDDNKYNSHHYHYYNHDDTNTNTISNNKCREKTKKSCKQ